MLPNSERFALGNATIGRGFAPGNTSGDSGWGGRLELRRDLPGAAFRPGRGRRALRLRRLRPRLRPLDRPRRRHRRDLGSVGIGARIDVRPWLTLTPEIARQTDGIATDTTDPDHETRFFIGAIARF